MENGLVAVAIFFRQWLRVYFELIVNEIHDPINRNIGSRVYALLCCLVVLKRRIGHLERDRDFIGTRVALKEGSLVVNSSQGGGVKDTWVLAE